MKGWRRDKKPQIAPYVPEWIHRLVHDIDQFTGNHSDSETSRQLIMVAYQNRRIIEKLSTFFLRDYCRGYSVYIGHDNHRNLDSIIFPQDQELERLWIRFSQEEWLQINELAYSLGRATAHAAAALLVLGLSEKRFIVDFAPGFEILRRIAIPKIVI